ncbi:MAG: CYTH domain-containing protein [Candidatus Dormibacteria bacterium]
MTEHTEGVEREVKFAVTGPCNPEAFAWSGIGLNCIHVGRITTIATYWDTRELDLFRAHASVRYRTHDGWTMKEAMQGKGAFVVRKELYFPGGRDEVPASIMERLAKQGIAGPVETVAEMETVREVFHLRKGNGVEVAELVLDEVTVPARKRTRFVELEVEMKGEDALIEENIVHLLEGERVLEREERSKLAHTLEILGRTGV